MVENETDKRTAPHTTLNRKLLRIMFGVLLLVAIATLGAVAWVNSETEEQRLSDVQELVRKNISNQANMMVDSHALALRGLVAENAFTDVQELVSRAVHANDDVLYGAFVSADDKPWAYSSPTTQGLRSVEQQTILRHWSELSLPAGSGSLREPTERELERFGQTVIEVSRPVIEGSEVLGVIRYGFSIGPLREALDRVRAESRQTLEVTLYSIGLAVLTATLLGFWLVSRASTRIVRPLKTLTDAAHTIATGKQGVRVEVGTNDELQILGNAFNHMQQANEDAMSKLSEAMQAALEASRLKSEFLANMSHEIRTPMNGVIGMIRLILKMPLEGKLRRYAETVDSSASALMTIINDILDFSKMEAGKYTLQTVPFDPSMILQDVAELQSSRAHDKGLEIVYRSAPDLPHSVMGDPDRYRQIVNNLVSNAVKFSDEGEVFVDVTADREADGSYLLRTVVQDSGIGIDEEHQSLLFDAFSQVDGSLVRRHGGTGLGLSISKKLAEMMGGKIGVSSTRGVGSTFWFTIRVSASEAPTRTMPEGFPEGRRVLVVESSRRWCRVIEEHLVAWGLTCDVMHDGGPALERLRQADPGRAYDLAVVGAQLRDVTIERFVREMREIPTAKEIPLVVLTQLGTGATLTEVEHEVSAQLSKPLRLSELYECILGTFVPNAAQHTIGPQQGPPRDRKDRCVLIVDDNEINRFVASEHVEQAGYLVDVAENGEQAVKKVQMGTYAAVLMDCQMPVLDGYSATRAIRAWEGDRRHTPIIALTAHAMAGERDKVLGAGMDDYLAKPLKAQALERMLQRYVMVEEAKEVVDQEVGPAPAPSALLDHTITRSARLSQLFIERVPITLKELEHAVDAAAVQLVRDHAHKLKGSCLALGAQAMAEQAETLQLEAEREDLSAAGKRASTLRKQYEEVAQLLRRELDSSSIRPSQPHGC